MTEPQTTNILEPKSMPAPGALGEEEKTPPPDNPEGGHQSSEVEQSPDDTDKQEDVREEDPKLAEKLAILMRREKALLQKERAFKESLRNDPDYLEFQKFKKLRESDNPDEALEHLGWGYEKLIRHKMGEKESEPSAEEKLQQRIDALEAKLSERETKEKESEEQRIQSAALQQIQKELEANESDYELTLLNNAESLVYDVIKEHHSSTGEVMPIAQAAKAVESYLEEQTEKLTKSRKLRKRFIPDEPENTEPEQEQKASSPPGNKAPTTISSKAIQSSVVDDDADDDWLDDEASKRRIAEKWKAGHYNRG